MCWLERSIATEEMDEPLRLSHNRHFGLDMRAALFGHRSTEVTYAFFLCALVGQILEVEVVPDVSR